MGKDDLILELSRVCIVAILIISVTILIALHRVSSGTATPLLGVLVGHSGILASTRTRRSGDRGQ